MTDTHAKPIARPPRREFLPYSPPFLGQEEIDEVAHTLRSDWITTGPKTRTLEERFAAAVDAPGGTSLMLNSCTAGLHVALATLGIGPGDEVIVPSLTFAATANVVVHVGATPVLVDVDPYSLCIDPAAVEAAITPATRCVIAVHFAGHPADLGALDRIVAKHGLALIEDAAHALPAHHHGTKIGSRPNLTAFSFYATKNMTTAEGGALTGDPALLERARVLSLHGMSKDAWKRFDKAGSWSYDVEVPGFKYNMTDVQASLGLHQLAKLPGFHRRRVEVADRYRGAFKSHPALRLPVEHPDVGSAWHLYILQLELERLTIDRNEFIEKLKSRNIGSSVHYRPLHRMSYYQNRFGFDDDAFPVSNDAFERMISIPLHPRLSDDDVDDVIVAVRDVADSNAA